MGEALEKLESEIKGLSTKEKAELAYFLIEELDGEMDPGAEEAWRQECENRYRKYQEGEIESNSGAVVFSRARLRLK